MCESCRLQTHARVAELADALDLGSSEATRGGSTPPSRTKQGVSEIYGERRLWSISRRSGAPAGSSASWSSKCLASAWRRRSTSIIEGIRQDVALPGFRKGKAPLDVIRARFGETARKEAIDRLIPEAYEQALKKEALRPVLPAEISDLTYGDAGAAVVPHLDRALPRGRPQALSRRPGRRRRVKPVEAGRRRAGTRRPAGADGPLREGRGRGRARSTSR